ncbi:unnamed protein product [Cochlearia groenlandica]
MSLNNLFSLLSLILSVSFGYVSTEICGDSLFFRPNGTYDTNRRQVLSTLASKVSSKDGFYNVSVGEGPGRIYALGMCIPGTDPQTCSFCIKSSSEYLLQKCPNQTDSYDWSPQKSLCFVRYSNISFFDKFDLEPYQAEYYTGDIPGNVTEFDSIWEDFMRRMIVAASSSTIGSPSRVHYAADMTPLTGFINIYALMHCIPGISSDDCRKCLLESVRTQQECCSKNKGSGVRRPVCFSRSDISQFYGAFDNITLSPPPQSPQTPPPPGDMPSSTKKVAILVVVVIIVGLVLAIVVLLVKRNSFNKKRAYKPMKVLESDGDITILRSMQYDLKTMVDATDNFSNKNKLGQGGFGVVYKGIFPCGTEIAVKRLSIVSKQGFQEFKNEVVVVAKLQHANLVKLIGFCLEEDEKILIYEFLSNKSLDLLLFDPVKKIDLDWTRRYNIIEGIARGILYLHRDSRPKIIHRDLKASNILLCADMNPKIADFGLAKIFATDQTRAETSKIAGTYGYMAPEYMNRGQFSMESDVYSFGVLVLEIISGKTSSRYYQIDDTDCNLVTFAWKLWRKGSMAKAFVDQTLGDNYQTEQVTRCIHVALLCVQADHANRPKMCRINLMLTSSKLSLSEPHEPGFFIGEEITSVHSLQFTFSTIVTSTDNFSDKNMIGRGGFGQVYKGKLLSGTEVAVKRLSKTSGQGAQEFKNEAVLLTKLQHRNLVRLLGFCSEGGEKILVYEFVPNKSLDYFLFDPTKQAELDWSRRYNIIRGIARGILYLHQDSRPTIIHRDLKVSNILLDAEMNPKIADFGMARTFVVDQSKDNTRKIVGTHGYMSPEYAMRGHFSMKSDVYSFGVIILEIISGKKNSSFYQVDDSTSNLVTHAWRLWSNESHIKLVDSTIEESYMSDEATRCIHIALLCVQDNPADRPMLSEIILMLTCSTMALPVPRSPGFCLSSMSDTTSISMSISRSIDDVSITNTDPR